MNKSEKNGAFKAYMRIRDWCHFLRFPCGNCPFSTPPYDYAEGCFEEGVEDCALADIILDGDKFQGYKLPKEKLDELADRGRKISDYE